MTDADEWDRERLETLAAALNTLPARPEFPRVVVAAGTRHTFAVEADGTERHVTGCEGCEIDAAESTSPKDFLATIDSFKAKLRDRGLRVASIEEWLAARDEDSDGERLAAAEGRALGYRMRAMLAESERAEAGDDAARWEAWAAHLAQTEVYLGQERATAHREITRLRDALAREQMRSELVADVLAAADAWSQCDGELVLRALRVRVSTLTDAIQRWQRAGRPGLAGEGGGG